MSVKTKTWRGGQKGFLKRKCYGLESWRSSTPHQGKMTSAVTEPYEGTYDLGGVGGGPREKAWQVGLEKKGGKLEATKGGRDPETEGH